MNSIPDCELFFIRSRPELPRARALFHNYTTPTERSVGEIRIFLKARKRRQMCDQRSWLHAYRSQVYRGEPYISMIFFWIAYLINSPLSCKFNFCIKLRRCACTVLTEMVRISAICLLV